MVWSSSNKINAKSARRQETLETPVLKRSYQTYIPHWFLCTLIADINFFCICRSTTEKLIKLHMTNGTIEIFLRFNYIYIHNINKHSKCKFQMLITSVKVYVTNQSSFCEIFLTKITVMFDVHVT